MSLFKLLAYFWSFLRDYKLFLIIPLTFALVLALQESFSPYLIKIIIDSIPKAQETGDWWPIYIVGIGYIFSIEVVNILFRLRDYFKLKVFPSVKTRMVNHMYSRLLNHAYHFHINQSSGMLANKVSDMVKGVETIFNMIVDVFLWRLLSLIFATITIYLASPMLSVVLLIWCIFFISGTLKLSMKVHSLAVIFSVSRNGLFGKITDGLSNILNILLYQKQKTESQVIDEHLKYHRQKEERLLKATLKIGFYQGLMVTFFTGMITASLIYGCQNGILSLGQFSLVIILSGTIIRNAYSISSDLVQFSKEFGACSQAMIVIEASQSILMQDNHQPLIITRGAAIRYHQVSYGYNRDNDVLRNISLSINAGDKIGLVGVSGGGKTTLISLLVRLFDPDCGKITIDGQNIKDVGIQSLRENISVVPQEPILFNRTIRENIQFGCDKATIEEVIQASKKAYCHEFITALDQGYESLVGERGQ